MAGKTNPGRASSKRNPKLDAVFIQLGSQRPSDVFRGMEKVRQLLKEDPENRDVYGLLLDAVKEHRDLREQVRNLLYEMVEKGSRSAQEAISSLPSSIQDFLADADDAYYAAEYERAVQLYRQVLKLDPENERAKDHLAKAEIKRITGESVTGLPRAAEQYYRRARSFIAARDVVTAMNLLSAAIEAAKGKGMPYPEADEALSNMQDLLTAAELRQQAKLMLEKEQWHDALEEYDKALKLDPTNELLKKERYSLRGLLEAENYLRRSGLSLIFSSLSKWQNIVDTARVVMRPASVLINSVEGKLNRISLMRWVSIALVLFVVALPFFSNQLPIWFSSDPTITPIPTGVPLTHTSIASVTSTMAVIEALASSTPTTISATPTITLTASLTATMTQATLGTGYINKATASAWREPNSGLLQSFGLNQALVLLERREVFGSFWYRCSWETASGDVHEGWILATNITFNPPTPTP